MGPGEKNVPQGRSGSKRISGGGRRWPGGATGVIVQGRGFSEKKLVKIGQN